MRAVTCGWTLQENFDFNLYYAPKSRGYSEHAYLGVYSQKGIKGIGKISNIITADLINGELKILDTTGGAVTEEQETNIKAVIPVALENNGWDISKNHKFFCVVKLIKTDFPKNSKYPLQGTKFFNLKDILEVDKLPLIEEIAEKLKLKEW